MMSNSTNKVSENPHAKIETKDSIASERIDNAKEIKEAKESGRIAVEAAGAVEAAETVEALGNVSESLGDVSDADLGGSATTSAGTALDPAKIREHLLKNMPSEVAMRKQIEQEIKKEITYLHRKAMKMMRSPKELNYFEMANLMKKIRELRGILMALFKSSVDTIKTLWLRYVHGVM